ncbi:hypothetical protein OAX78_00715 [Planctomycetota bacterium]|nr:hypothetical protein [Planctomycetota bacterium]
MTVGDARDKHLRDNGFGDGGYDDTWVYVKFGWIPAVIPNTKRRRKEIQCHDLHHVVAGMNGVYNQGEIDLIGYEIRGRGVGLWPFAWYIFLNLFALGLVWRPRALFRTFVRARDARTLFGKTVTPEILAMSVGELRAHLGWADPQPAIARDRWAFAGWALASCAFVLAELATVGGVLAVGWSLLS